MNDIQVTAEGHVHVGQNVWVSLEQIEQAVLAKQTGNNPGLSFNTVPGEGRKPGKPTPNTNQQHSFETVRNYPFAGELQRISGQQPIGNARQESLPLPSTLIRNDDQQTNNAGCGCSGEHLELPSTAR